MTYNIPQIWRISSANLGTPKRFQIHNLTPYPVYVYISFRTVAPCDFDSFHIKPHATVNVWKAGGCTAQKISGYLYTPRAEIGLVEWNGSAGAGGGANWKIQENGQGSATINFLSHEYGWNWNASPATR